jgi:cell division protein FtsQ
MKAERRIYASKNIKDISAQRRLSLYIKRIFFILKILLLSAFLFLTLTKQFADFKLDVRHKISEYLAEIGFALDNVVIIGQKNITNSEVVASLNADTGTPIYDIDLSNSHRILAKNSWVKSALVQRKLPDTIIVTLYEKDPVAVWQVNRELFVIDSDGEPIKGAKPENFAGYIHVVGEDANIYAAELVSAISSNPSLAGKVRYAVRYGQRRWDMHLEENITVRMPQYDFAAAYNYLSKLYNEEKLFGNKIKSIDLRDISKIYVEKEKAKK